MSNCILRAIADDLLNPPKLIYLSKEAYETATGKREKQCKCGKALPLTRSGRIAPYCEECMNKKRKIYFKNERERRGRHDPIEFNHNPEIKEVAL